MSKTTRKIIRASAFIISLLFLISVLIIIDIEKRGPYTTWYNNLKMQQAEKHAIIGKSEGEVIKCLGNPSFSYMRSGHNNRTLNYAPFSFFPYGLFQVHLRNGIVHSVEMFDD